MPSVPSGTHQPGSPSLCGWAPPSPGEGSLRPAPALAQLTWSPGSPAGFTCGFPGAPPLLLTPLTSEGGWATSSELKTLLSRDCSASRDRAKWGRPGGGEGGSCFHQPLTSCPGPPRGPPAPSVNRRWEQAFLRRRVQIQPPVTPGRACSVRLVAWHPLRLTSRWSGAFPGR